MMQKKSFALISTQRNKKRKKKRKNRQLGDVNERNTSVLFFSYSTCANKCYAQVNKVGYLRDFLISLIDLSVFSTHCSRLIMHNAVIGKGKEG